MCLPQPVGTESPPRSSLPLEKVLCHTRTLPGAWVTGQSAGGCRNNSCFPCNPKFWLRLLEPSEVCVAVLQRPQRRLVGQTRTLVGAGPTPANLPGKDYQAVGLHIWKVTPVCWPHGGKVCRHIGGLGPRSLLPWPLIHFPCPVASGTSGISADAADSKPTHPTPEVEAILIPPIPIFPKHHTRADACLCFPPSCYPLILPLQSICV